MSLPLAETLIQAAKKALDEDKPIMMDYWADPNAVLGFKSKEEKMLVKGSDEYTSLIVVIYEIKSQDKSRSDYIVATENSLYLVPGNIKKAKLA